MRARLGVSVELWTARLLTRGDEDLHVRDEDHAEMREQERFAYSKFVALKPSGGRESARASFPEMRLGASDLLLGVGGGAE